MNINKLRMEKVHFYCMGATTLSTTTIGLTTLYSMGQIALLSNDTQQNDS